MDTTEDLKSKLSACDGRIQELEKIIQLIQQWTISSFGEDIPNDILNYKLDEKSLENNDHQHLRNSELPQNIVVKIEPEDYYFESPPSPIRDNLEPEVSFSVPDSTRKTYIRKGIVKKENANAPYLQQEPAVPLPETKLKSKRKNLVKQYVPYGKNKNVNDGERLIQTSTSKDAVNNSRLNLSNLQLKQPSEILEDTTGTCTTVGKEPCEESIVDTDEAVINHKYYTCGDCGYVLLTEIRLTNHYIKCGHGGYIHKCDVCYQFCLDLNDHYETTHSANRPMEKCGECSIELYKEEFMKHLKLTGHKRYRCHLCPFINHFRTRMDQHREKHLADEGKFGCPNCPKKFKLPIYRDAHVKRQVCTRILETTEKESN